LGIALVSVAELSPPNVRTTVLGVFLFAMNNVGGNLPVLVDPVSKVIGYREALYCFYPAFVTASEFLYASKA
jgi:hypothetical protein